MLLGGIAVGVDAFVMPLWKYKTGDFETASERLLGAGKVRFLGAKRNRPKAGVLGSWQARKARKEVETIKVAVMRENHRAVSWPDEGSCVYSEQANGLEALRAYALWLHHQDEIPSFTMPPECDFYQHPCWKCTPREKAKASHLIMHSLHSGYFLPAHFETMVKVEPYLAFGVREFHREVGSSYVLMDELEAIGKTTDMTVKEELNEDDPMCYVRAAYRQLYEIAELSIRHRLPIVFWG